MSHTSNRLMACPAFSTVACPDAPLDQVLRDAAMWGVEAVDLRSFAKDSDRFASDPALISADKVRAMAEEHGVSIACLSTSVRFDEPVWPPIIGSAITDTEGSIRAGKDAVRLAASIECPFVRVFGFELTARESVKSGLRRIADRLRQVVDSAQNTGVRVVIENGGILGKSDEMLELLHRVDHPLLGVSYALASATLAEVNIENELDALGEHVWVARVKDAKAGVPCALGEGDMNADAFVQALVASGFAGPLIYEWDMAWTQGLASAETVVPAAVQRLYGVLAETSVAH